MLVGDKVDVKVASYVLQEMDSVKSIAFCSDFCALTDSAVLYHKTNNLGRKDPTEADSQLAKKPSHNAVDCYHLLAGIAENMRFGKLETVRIVKIRPGGDGWNRLQKGI